MNLKQKERYLRWQDYRIAQFSFSINLFLGFAVASLAYVINLKLGKQRYSTIPFELIIFWWSISSISGCLATISKLVDYRYTARKIKDGGVCNTFIAKWSGLLTWVFFWIQVISYSRGAYLFIIGVLSV